MNGFSQTREKILAPVGLGFIILSLFIAFMLNIMPWGRVYGVPDFLALVLIFWCIYQGHRIGIGTAFCLGVLMDVNNATFLGETALAYTLMVYFAITLHKQILWFSPAKQIWYVLLLLFIPPVVEIVIQFIVGNWITDGFWIFDCVVGAIIWPLIHWLLMWPQRKIERTEAKI